jgi:hypothetical protein
MGFATSRKWIVAAVVGVLLAAAVVVWKPTGSAKAAETLRFFAPYQKAEFNEVDVDGDGAKSVGDLQSGRFNFYRNGKENGNFLFTCTLAASGPWRQVCEGGFRVPGKGRIFVVAAPEREDTNKSVVAIAGGSGSYAGAMGTAVLDFSHRRGAHITIRLQ